MSQGSASTAVPFTGEDVPGASPGKASNASKVGPSILRVIPPES